MLHHMTYLRASEDYTSQHDLESSEAQHMTLKTYREEEQIATKSTTAKEDSFREKLHAFNREAIACIAQIEQA